MMHVHQGLGLRFYPIVLAAIGLEILCYVLVQKRAYPWGETLASLGVYVLRVPARLLRPLIVGPIALFVWSHRIATIPLDTAWGLALLFLGAGELRAAGQHLEGFVVQGAQQEVLEAVPQLVAGGLGIDKGVQR